MGPSLEQLSIGTELPADEVDGNVNEHRLADRRPDQHAQARDELLRDWHPLALAVVDHLAPVAVAVVGEHEEAARTPLLALAQGCSGDYTVRRSGTDDRHDAAGV